MNTPSNITVICPIHGEHEYAIESNIPGHEGVWCQLCWLASQGPSLPYRREVCRSTTKPDDPDDFKTMKETAIAPEEGWKTLPKE